MSSVFGVKGGTGFIGARRRRRELCDCDGCTQRRLFMCDQIEAQIEAKRAAGKQCPPPRPDQNAPSSFRLH